MPYHINRASAGALIALLIAAALIACSQPPAEAPAPPAPTTPAPAAAPPTAPPATSTPKPPPTSMAMPVPTATAMPVPTAATAPTPEPTTAASSEPATTAQDAMTFVLGEGTVARYKVEEVLAGTGFTVATGETTDVVGRISFDADGGIIPHDSGIVVQAASLKTDSDRRDRYVRERTLQTSEFPAIIFQPKSVEGLPMPPSEVSGAVEFTISGDLTIRDQTRAVTWDVAAEVGDDITGLATIDITFEQFGMDKPRVAVVVSVEDTIRLELDLVGSFRMAGAINVDGADSEAYAQIIGDPGAPVTIIEFSDFQ